MSEYPIEDAPPSCAGRSASLAVCWGSRDRQTAPCASSKMRAGRAGCRYFCARPGIWKLAADSLTRSCGDLAFAVEGRFARVVIHIWWTDSKTDRPIVFGSVTPFS